MTKAEAVTASDPPSVPADTVNVVGATVAPVVKFAVAEIVVAPTLVSGAVKFVVAVPAICVAPVTL